MSPTDAPALAWKVAVRLAGPLSCARTCAVTGSVTVPRPVKRLRSAALSAPPPLASLSLPLAASVPLALGVPAAPRLAETPADGKDETSWLLSGRATVTTPLKAALSALGASSLLW